MGDSGQHEKGFDRSGDEQAAQRDKRSHDERGGTDPPTPGHVGFGSAGELDAHGDDHCQRPWHDENERQR